MCNVRSTAVLRRGIETLKGLNVSHTMYLSISFRKSIIRSKADGRGLVVVVAGVLERDAFEPPAAPFAQRPPAEISVFRCVRARSAQINQG